MAECRDLLIEIGTEELPPKALNELVRALGECVVRGLGQRGLEAVDRFDYATPRRLALKLCGLPETQRDQVIERKGPALTAAFDEDGRPTRAAEGFARSCGVDVDALERLETPRGAWLVYRSISPGRPTVELIPEVVTEALAALPIPKRMRWGARSAEFVRPVHWVVLLFGETLIEAEILGIPSGRHSYGHRFHHPGPLPLSSARVYPQVLEQEGFVQAEFSRRRASIERQVAETARALGGQAMAPPELVDEVTALVEWPVAISGSFDSRFLEVPQEVLVTTMQGHQRYFPVTGPDGRLLPFFVTISNIESRDPAQVRAGNERVIRPRFADAEFFWEQDKKTPLVDRRLHLAEVIFEERLGSLLDKSDRLIVMCEHMATALGADVPLAGRAGELAKCDLLTEMVTEFPSLQGIMGRYYALCDGEPGEVAAALDEQYMPRHSGGELPKTTTGRILALSDRLDTLVGIFAIGERPSGVKDPYGLRRAALGVLRVLIEAELDLDLEGLLGQAAGCYPEALKAHQVVSEVFDYVMERLKAYYGERGIGADVVESVMARRPTSPLDLDLRIRAVEHLRTLPEAQALAAANKRIANILRRVEAEPGSRVDPALFEQPEERILYERLQEVEGVVDTLLEQRRYVSAMSRLAALREPVDAFFDAVMVMTEDPRLRTNRVALLSRLRQLFIRVADLSCLQGSASG